MAPSLGSDYRRLWWSSGLSNLADGVAVVAMPLLAVQLTRAPVAIAAVTLAGRLPWLLFALHAGALADRLDRRRVMVGVNVARAVTFGALAAFVAADLASLPALVATAFALGVAETLFDTSAHSIMPSVVAREQLSRGNGRLYAVELTANQFLGPPLGGVLAAVSIGLASPAAHWRTASPPWFWCCSSVPSYRPGPVLGQRWAPTWSKGCVTCGATGCCARSVQWSAS